MVMHNSITFAQDREIPKKLRDRDHIEKVLQLDTEENVENEKLKKVTEHTLKELKKIYDSAIKPMEILYKYRDLSNRHFGGKMSFKLDLVTPCVQIIL